MIAFVPPEGYESLFAALLMLAVVLPPAALTSAAVYFMLRWKRRERPKD